MTVKLFDVLDAYVNNFTNISCIPLSQNTWISLYCQRISYTGEQTEHPCLYLFISQNFVSKEIARSTEKGQAVKSQKIMTENWSKAWELLYSGIAITAQC